MLRSTSMAARHPLIALWIVAACGFAPLEGSARAQPGTASQTRIVMLGTGTPSPDAERSGPATAIVVNGTPYLIDFGPGVVRRIAAASQKGVTGLSVLNIKHVFLTHLHSDHTAGYPDLILTPWSVGRTHALEVYGPRGLANMTRHILEAYAEDIRIRRQDKNTLGRPGEIDGYKVNAHDITPGVIFQDANVKVTAFAVRHGDVPGALGYRFETADRTIVISGDAAPSQSVIDACNGCDVLIHEAYSLLTYNAVTRPYQEYREKHHTSSRQLAELATKARPGLLILYHRANPGGVGKPNPEDVLLNEVRAHYSGTVVTAHDLDVF
jgi:ribonuclease BN (tRNA processing enzyme)